MTGLVVDPRAGSKTLIKPLRKLAVRVTVETLDYGDVAFWGNGPDGPVQVGIEHKRVEDVLDCIKSGRFASHQLPGLIDNYGVVVLLVQGRFRASADNLLMIEKQPAFRGGAKFWARPHAPRNRPWTYTALSHWLHSIQFQGGIHVAQVEDTAASAMYIRALYSWWTTKEWSEHSTLKVFNESGAVSMTKPTVAATVAKAVRGIGWDKAHAVGRHFGTPEKLTAACVNDWLKIPGIGRELARRAVRAMQVEGVR